LTVLEQIDDLLAVIGNRKFGIIAQRDRLLLAIFKHSLRLLQGMVPALYIGSFALPAGQAQNLGSLMFETKVMSPQ
jgi:hypothetical protein